MRISRSGGVVTKGCDISHLIREAAEEFYISGDKLGCQRVGGDHTQELTPLISNAIRRNENLIDHEAIQIPPH
ncbi:hypothetical protein PanWU01x14_057540 [Parasponia andersonii]|uniref:Uncharacterized protein n=1 Tax=Parasponia andersonii TaxID=3476 RepID=A0A2P5DJU7_PARAD|nr:hypothetical protein PanWU01x14_057540 [Parasponia andersonii]